MTVIIIIITIISIIIPIFIRFIKKHEFMALLYESHLLWNKVYMQDYYFHSKN